LPSFAEIPYQNKPVRIPSRTKTKSPNRDLDDDDSDVSHSSSRYSHRNKITSNFIRNPLSISTRDGNLSDHEQRFTRNLSDNEQRSGRSLEAEDRKDKSTTRSQDGSVTRSEQDREFRFVRSYSDGDLTDYLKGFSDLKASLSMAQITCNSEIRKILDDLQLNFQKSLDEKIEPKVTKVRNKSKPLLRVDIVKTNKPFVKSPLSPNSAMISPNYQQKQLEDAIKTMKPDLALRGSDSKKIDKVDLGETSPLLDALLQVIAIAQNILDLSLTQVMAPNVVSSIIQQLQQMQFLWRKNPTWQLHDLVLRLLIVFSSVARIMEYFEQDLRNWVDLKEEHGRPVQRKLKNISSLSSLRSGFSESEDNNDSEYSHDSPHRRKKYTPNLLSFSETSKNAKAFRDAVDEDQNLNVLIELSQYEICTYVSQSCAKLFQYSPAQIVGQSIIPFLIDKNVFLEACKETKLDNVQIQFWCKRLDGRTVKMEGKGLIKREDDSSIWIIRPLKVSRGVDSPNLLPAVIPEIKTDKTEIPNIDLALCSICENSVPALMFKIHTEACLKIHRTEMDLVLLNDEIKKEILKCENNDVILKSEIKTVDKELKVVHFDENKTGYMEYLANLSIINVEILTKLKKLKLSMAKEDEMVEFKCGNEKLYIQNLDDDPGIQELGHGVYICGKTLQEYISQKKILLKKLWEESSTFQEMLSQELSLMQEIQKQSNLITEDEYQKFETKEIGGVIVRIPSIAPEKKESLFFQEESRSRYSSDSSLGSQEEEPKKALKRKQKHNILRVNVSEVQRRPSLRSSRMLVGDKTLEIEPGSPLLNSRHSSFSFLNINRPLASPIAPTPTIKEYEIIKPISKGAFGSVFLAKKKISGDYFAIKVLKKSDMVAKNQAMNIKSERTILTQIDSPYIVKLFSTFQSKDRIFLVMEYLNGGDCASLLKSFGNLDETWAKQYITEMIQGLEFLHHKDIVHRYIGFNIGI
jgi:PAS domain-containing protein